MGYVGMIGILLNLHEDNPCVNKSAVVHDCLTLMSYFRYNGFCYYKFFSIGK